MAQPLLADQPGPAPRQEIALALVDECRYENETAHKGQGNVMRTAIFAAAGLIAATTAAEAGVVVLGFDYDATLRAGSNTQTINPDFPSGGLQQINNGGSPEARNSYAAATGYGASNPLDFASGASAAGNAVVTVTNNVRVELTNDSGVMATASLDSLIYGGGVGLALADFSAPDCVFAQIAQCGAFSGAPSDTGQVANLFFEAVLDGVRLFTGTISVDPTNGAVAVFDGVTLANFGLAAGNPSFFSWTDTFLDDVSLGTFGIGETKLLEFNTSIFVGSLRGVDSDACTTLECAVAQAGFGDPRGGSGGGVITYSSAPASTPFSLFSLRLAPAPVVPVPPALALFPLGLAALASARRRARKA